MFYTKFYPSAYYEYDSRGVVTINVLFNGKVVGTYKYDSNTGSSLPPEVSYIHNSYNSTPVLQTDSTGSTTAVIKRDVWGDMLSNNYNSNEIIPTSYGLTGHKWDDNAGITYSHARYLSNKNRIWLSHDPYSIENFTADKWLMNPQYQNSYSYVANNPVNAIDPDGKLIVVIPGTFYDPFTWSADGTAGNFVNDMQNYFQDNNVYYFNDKNLWSGDDNDKARVKAAKNLADYINNYKFADGEKLQIFGHSHGGNVGKLVTNLIDHKVDNFITLGTPVLDKYNVNKNIVGNYVSAFSFKDNIQNHGGNQYSVSKILGGVGFGIGGYILGGFLNWGEFGKAGRVDSNANVNISLTDNTDKKNFGLDAHSQLYSVVSIWTDRLQSEMR